MPGIDDVSFIRPDGTGHLSRSDLVLVLDALQLAAALSLSSDHATAWRALAWRLGDDR